MVQFNDRHGTSGQHGHATQLLMARNRNISYLDHARYISDHPSSTTAGLPPYWGKVLLVKEALRDVSCAYALWLDADAALHATPSKIVSLMPEEKHMVIAAERRPIREFRTKNKPALNSEVPQEFNAGVFVVRNSRIGRHLIDEWLSLYPEELWTRNRTTGRWRCRQQGGQDCPWALKGYEQGAFAAHHLRTESLSRQIHTVGWRMLNNPCRDAADLDGVLVCHFSFYDKKKNIAPYVRSQASCMPGGHAFWPSTKSQSFVLGPGTRTVYTTDVRDQVLGRGDKQRGHQVRKAKDQRRQQRHDRDKTSAAQWIARVAQLESQVELLSKLVMPKAKGLSCAEVRAMGLTAMQAKAAGYVEGLKAAGYTLQEAKAAGYTLQEIKAAGYTAQEAKAAGYTAQEAKEARRPSAGGVDAVRRLTVKEVTGADAAFAITLDTKEGRRRMHRMRKSIVGPHITKIDGVHGKALAPEEYAGVVERTRRSRPLSPGEVGCILGHRKAWQAVVDSGVETAMVLEDDASAFSSDFVEKVALILKHTPSDWGILLLGFWLQNHARGANDDDYAVNDIIYRVFDFVLTDCYLITRATAQALLRSTPVDSPLDSWISRQSQSIPIYRHTFELGPPHESFTPRKKRYGYLNHHGRLVRQVGISEIGLHTNR